MKEKTKVQSREKDQYDGEEPGVEEYLADLLDKSLTEQERKNVEDASDENVLFYNFTEKVLVPLDFGTAHCCSDFFVALSDKSGY